MTSKFEHEINTKFHQNCIQLKTLIEITQNVQTKYKQNHKKINDANSLYFEHIKKHKKLP